MTKIRFRSLFLFFFIFSLITCIDPYYPHLSGYNSLLVVDGMVTDQNAAYIVRLSRTKQDRNANTLMISDATVFITDDKANKTYLKSSGSGIYKTDSLQFIGSEGQTYILHLITTDGEEYESEPCLMYPVPDIDSIYFEKHEDPGTNWSEGNTGLLISLDAKPGDENQFYRWDYEETWKFKVPNPSRFIYISDTDIYAIPDVKEYCWKNQKSDDILIHSVHTGQNSHIGGEPIKFIATQKSDRLTLQYSILVKQYSVSEEEYDFWNGLKMVNESGGDIFESQPFSVMGNIRNINNPDERVLGYFQVSALKQQRKNISLSDIASLDLPNYIYPCALIAKSPDDYPPPFRTSFNEIYRMFCVDRSEYAFVEPLYYPGTFNLLKLVFTTKECADCEVTGTSTKPDFWIDID
jgi:hypothetical protein